MAEQKTKRKGRRNGYVHRKNALHVTFYSPYGDNVPKHVMDQIEQATLQVALDNNLLIGTAKT